MDKKSLLRILSKLGKDGQIKNITVQLQLDEKTKVCDFRLFIYHIQLYSLLKKSLYSNSLPVECFWMFMRASYSYWTQIWYYHILSNNLPIVVACLEALEKEKEKRIQN